MQVPGLPYSQSFLVVRVPFQFPYFPHLYDHPSGEKEVVGREKNQLLEIAMGVMKAMLVARSRVGDDA
eukprot:33851-Pyramimonas_sp.AAC.1